MKLITKHQEIELLSNGRASRAANNKGKLFDPRPVVKLFTPDAACTWLLSEIDPDDTDVAFGLCDLGMGMPELGSVRFSELQSVRGKLGLPVERDRFFSPDKTIGKYADDAITRGHINA